MRAIELRLTWAAACVVVVVALAAGVSSTAAVSAGSPATTAAAGAPASQLQRIVVGDLSLLVPAEWRKVKRTEPTGITSTYMADPKHKPANAVTFSVYSWQAEPGADTVPALGAVLFDTLKKDKQFSAVRWQLMHLPAVAAAQLRFDVALEGGKFIVTYEATRAQAGHMTQFLASARSMRYTQGPYEPDIHSHGHRDAHPEGGDLVPDHVQIPHHLRLGHGVSGDARHRPEQEDRG